MRKIMKAELIQARKQALDAKSSYNFMRKEKLRVEHEKNLLDIQLKQSNEMIAIK